MSATTMGEVWPHGVGCVSSFAHSLFQGGMPCVGLVITVAILTAMGGKAAANLCEIRGQDPHPTDPWVDGVDSGAANWRWGFAARINTGYGIDRGRYDWLDGWRYDYLDQFQYRLLGGSRHGRALCEGAPGLATAIWDPECAVRWPSATGDYLDRWRYAYLDQGRYRFLDLTQYRLLGRFRGTGWWCYHGWCANGVTFLPPRWTRITRERDPAIPEPCTAAFLAMGALIVLRTRKRNDIR